MKKETELWREIRMGLLNIKCQSDDISKVIKENDLEVSKVENGIYNQLDDVLEDVAWQVEKIREALRKLSER